MMAHASVRQLRRSAQWVGGELRCSCVLQEPVCTEHSVLLRWLIWYRRTEKLKYCCLFLWLGRKGDSPRSPGVSSASACLAR